MIGGDCVKLSFLTLLRFTKFLGHLVFLTLLLFENVLKSYWCSIRTESNVYKTQNITENRGKKTPSPKYLFVK